MIDSPGLVLEQIIKDWIRPDSKVSDQIAGLNEAFRREHFGPKWSFIEAGLSAEDKGVIIIQMTLGSQPRTFCISLHDIRGILNG